MSSKFLHLKGIYEPLKGSKTSRHSRGYLSHIDGGGLIQFVTIRLADSLPESALKELLTKPNEIEDDKQARYQQILDAGYGSSALQQKRIAALIESSIKFQSNVTYELLAWVVMPNHVHLMIRVFENAKLWEIIRKFKSFTGLNANRLLGRSGSFWARDYFDRYIRDAQHLAFTQAYIENNPVQAKLCLKAENWRYSSAWRSSL